MHSLPGQMGELGIQTITDLIQRMELNVFQRTVSHMRHCMWGNLGGPSPLIGDMGGLGLTIEELQFSAASLLMSSRAHGLHTPL